MVEVSISSYSDLSELNGKATFKEGDRVISVEFLKDYETEDPFETENPMFWQITLKSDTWTIKITPSQLPWSGRDKVEITASFFPNMTGMIEGWAKLEIMAFYHMLDSFTEDCIAAEERVPPWLMEVWDILHSLVSDYDNQCLPSALLSEE